jgi:D-psicose/D-tagatose/L-ribulose 3-epimerase
MSKKVLGKKDIFLSFFMFTIDVKPSDLEYRKVLIKHMKELKALGYNGFELPIAANEGAKSFSQEIDEYSKFRYFLNEQGLENVQIATNVGTTSTFNPSSSDPKQREKALEYLKSRVDITAALGGKIMMGPLVIPYGIFPLTNAGNPIWSDQLQDYLETCYSNAQPILNQLGEYAEPKNVKLAIEPITHWETPGINKLSQLIKFLKGVSSKQVGVVIDSSHEILDGDGPEVFAEQVKQIADEGRLHYVQVSPPDRGAVHTSWIPWQSFLEPIMAVYDGPIAVEIFNAIPAFLNSLRLSRRKFWIPGEDKANQYPSAYEIAKKAIDTTQRELSKIHETK